MCDLPMSVNPRYFCAGIWIHRYLETFFSVNVSILCKSVRKMMPPSEVGIHELFCRAVECKLSSGAVVFGGKLQLYSTSIETGFISTSTETNKVQVVNTSKIHREPDAIVLCFSPTHTHSSSAHIKISTYVFLHKP